MNRSRGLHTVPDARGGWSNTLDGRRLSWHPEREEAIAAGRAIAGQLAVALTVHGADGGIVGIEGGGEEDKDAP